MIDYDAEKRWRPMSGSRLMRDADEQLTFIAQMGEYDVCWDRINGTYTVIKERPPGAVQPSEAGHYNFTDFEVLSDGNLNRIDDDLILDPYHMCMLYQIHEEVGHTLEVEDEED